MNRKAFTLIELLVILVILGMIAGLLFFLISKFTETEEQRLKKEELQRFSVTWKQTDYTSQRIIYVIKDKETNEEWLFIDGSGAVITPIIGQK